MRRGEGARGPPPSRRGNAGGRGGRRWGGGTRAQSPPAWPSSADGRSPIAPSKPSPSRTGDAVFWDGELLGFGVRVYPSGAKVYVVQTRREGRSKRVTVGRHGVISAPQARRRAALMIARLKAGEDPRSGPFRAGRGANRSTVAELADRFPSRVRGGALQAVDGHDLPGGARAVESSPLSAG